MISSISSRVVTPVQTAVTTPPAAPPAPAPAATSYFQDAMEYRRPVPVNLSGVGNASPVSVPALASPVTPEAGGSSGLGPRFLHLDAGWTPQGQGYDAKRKEVLTTYYDEGRGVLLSAQKKDSGRETQQVILGGRSPDHPAGPPTHGGGVSTNGKFVYVADTEHIYVYKREDIENAKKGTEVNAIQVMEVQVSEEVDDPASDLDLRSRASYMTVKGNYAYVGGYSPDGDDKAGAVWRYRLDEDGTIIKGSRQGPIRAPDQAQGMTVVDGALVFTTGDNTLYYQPFKASRNSFEADLADRKEIGNGLIEPYAQGVNVIDGELWVTYESGSHKYREDLDPPYKPREHIQRIPLEDLDLEAAGLTPEQLKR